LCSSLSPVLPQLARCGRTDGGAQSQRRSRHHLALGSAVRTGAGTALSPRTPHNQPVLACGRDLLSRGRQMDLFI
jgi:hypothetical protein